MLMPAYTRVTAAPAVTRRLFDLIGFVSPFAPPCSMVEFVLDWPVRTSQVDGGHRLTQFDRQPSLRNPPFSVPVIPP